MKKTDFPEKYPETQTRPKNPRSSGKKPSGGNTCPTGIRYEV